MLYLKSQVIWFRECTEIQAKHKTRRLICAWVEDTRNGLWGGSLANAMAMTTAKRFVRDRALHAGISQLPHVQSQHEGISECW